MLPGGAQKRSAAMAFWGPQRSRFPHGMKFQARKPTGFAVRQANPWQRGRGRMSATRAVLQKNSGELKGMDTAMAITGPVISTTNTNADSFTLNLVEPGNGSYNRIGRKIFNKSVRISGDCAFQGNTDPTTGASTDTTLRMVVVWDKQPSGVLPTFDLMFGRTDLAGAETAAVFDHLRYDNTARFQVLRDCYTQSKQVPSHGGTTNVNLSVYHFDEFIDLKNRTTVFSGDSDPVTIADISSGALYVYFRARNSTANVVDWSVDTTMFSRLRFTS